tara:strand:+ start:664 stop:837 length:174 start_codon:yes stop_codon:yes gene_type:complete
MNLAKSQIKFSNHSGLYYLRTEQFIDARLDEASATEIKNVSELRFFVDEQRVGPYEL